MTSTDRSIVILGAGPAGLSMAMYLKERGYHDVTVLEKEDNVGGKCESLLYEGKAYDLGANLTTPRYEVIRPLAEEVGLTLSELADRRVVSVTTERPPSTDLNRLQRLVAQVATDVYVLFRNGTNIDQHGFAGLKKGVRRPFKRWLRKHGLASMREVFANLFVAYGYGVMDDLPAAYALKFFDEVHINTALSVIFGDNTFTTRVFAEGFQELWIRVVDKYDIDVRKSAEVFEIRRHEDGVEVKWNDPGGQHRKDYDILVLACPLDETLKFMDCSRAERRLFEQIEYYDYYVTATILKNIPDISTFIYPFSMQWTPGWPTVFYPPFPGDPNDVFMFYSYGDEHTTVEQVQANLRDIIARPEFNGELQEILLTKHWRYFPHVTSDAMLDGFYDDLEALQGVNRTFYAGEILSFTLVELVTRYSRNLVATRF